MSLTFTFKSKDDPANTLNLFDSLIKDIKADNEDIKKQISLLGSQTQDKMKDFINGNKVRPQNGEAIQLENSITLEIFDKDGWGIGDIDYLNTLAPYWAAINWGSSHMVGRRVPSGYFSPGIPNPTVDAFRDGRWVENEFLGGGMVGGNTGFPGTGGAHWSFIVKNPIMPMNYIENTVFWLDDKFNAIRFSK